MWSGTVHSGIFFDDFGSWRVCKESWNLSLKWCVMTKSVLLYLIEWGTCRNFSKLWLVFCWCHHLCMFWQGMDSRNSVLSRVSLKKIHTGLCTQKEIVKLTRMMKMIRGCQNRIKLKRNILFVSGATGKYMTLALNHTVLWSTIIQFAFLMFYRSCHYLNKISVPHLTLSSYEFITLNQLFPQQLCCYKHRPKTSVSMRKICCSGKISFMWTCVLFRGNGNNFCVLFLFQVVFLLIFTMSYS